MQNRVREFERGKTFGPVEVQPVGARGDAQVETG